MISLKFSRLLMISITNSIRKFVSSSERAKKQDNEKRMQLSLLYCSSTLILTKDKSIFQDLELKL